MCASFNWICPIYDSICSKNYWLMQNMTKVYFYFYMIWFVLNMTGFVLNMTGFVPNMNWFVQSMTRLNRTKFFQNFIGFALYKTCWSNIRQDWPYVLLYLF